MDCGCRVCVMWTVSIRDVMRIGTSGGAVAVTRELGSPLVAVGNQVGQSCRPPRSEESPLAAVHERKQRMAQAASGLGGQLGESGLPPWNEEWLWVEDCGRRQMMAPWDCLTWTRP